MNMASSKVAQKRRRIEADILSRSIPLIECGDFAHLSIRELCAKISITTGLYYRHFRSKNDLLSFYAIEKTDKLIRAALPSFERQSLGGNLLKICMLCMRANLNIGPESILVF